MVTWLYIVTGLMTVSLLVSRVAATLVGQRQVIDGLVWLLMWILASKLVLSALTLSAG